MPFIPNPIPILVVKAVGYGLAGKVLQKSYKSQYHFALFSIVRIASGLILGLVSLPVFLTSFGEKNEVGFYVWLFAVRITVWSILIWLIFERGNFRIERFLTVVFLGIIWSFTLDGILYLLEKQFPDLMKMPFC